MPWTNGQSGNPKGRPRHSIRGELNRLASKKLPDGNTNARAVAAKAWEMARDGRMQAIVFVTEQIDGKLVEQVALAGDFTIRFTGMDDGPRDSTDE